MIQITVKEQLAKLDNFIGKLEAGHFEAYVVSDAEYSIYQEFGTKRSSAHPYMVPAVEANEQSLPAAIRLYGLSKVDKAVRDVAQMVATDARMLAPYDTGFLKGNIKVQKEAP